MLDIHALDIRKRPTVYMDFFKCLLQPSVVVTESDPVLSTLGSKILGLVRYECIVTKINEAKYSRVYNVHLKYIEQHIHCIVSFVISCDFEVKTMTIEAALENYLHSLVKDKEGLMKLKEWIEKCNGSDSYNIDPTPVCEEDMKESKNDCDSEEYIGIVPTESGVTFNVLVGNLSHIIVNEGIDESYADKLLREDMGKGDLYDYEEEDETAPLDNMPPSVKKNPNRMEQEND